MDRGERLVSSFAVELFVDFEQVFVGDVGVHLGRRNVRMTKQCLD